jgi:predicted trehalose synthase
LDSGFLGLSKVSAAQLNPVLLRSYATALTPHIGELVGGQQNAFDALRTQVADDPLALRNLLSVFVADPEAGRTAVEATHSAAEQYEINAAAAPPDSDESAADLRAAGSLLGAAYGAVHLAGSDNPTPPVGEAANAMAVRVAAILVPADPNAAKVSQYVQGGRLMSPAEIESKFSNTAMRTFYLDLQDYISGKGFGDGISTFHNAFIASSGVPAP